MHSIENRLTKLAAASFALGLGSSAFAQQFQNQPGMIPGTARWSEGVECADVENDGDLDIFFADGEGFSTAGATRQNVLVINKLIENGSLSFADESVARLGTHLSNAKGVCTGDINADGYVDALFANAFNTAPASLYVNQGSANPGIFTFDGVARGFTTNISAGGGMFADVDNDGDLDVVINNNYLGTGSGVNRLYLNNGSGFFTLTAGAFGSAPNKSSHMDVQMVDLDNDWHLDLFGDNRAANGGVPHFLQLGDSTGVFTENSSVVPNTSGNCYEGEVGDLDNDGDIDMFMVSMSGFAEGALSSQLVPSGTLSYTLGSGLGGDDDNEIALYDYDVDGDYDAFVGSLGAREKIWTNNGGMSFSSSSTLIQAVSDSTLDMTVADLNNDGRYDLVTAQGESNAAQWANKVYLNTSGAVDNLPPVVSGVQALANVPNAGPVVVQAKVRDQVLDDGIDYLTVTADFVVLTTPVTVNVSITAGGFSPAVNNIAAGTSLLFTNNSGVTQTVTSTTSPYTFNVTLAAGQTYQHYFVKAGTYNFTSTTSGLNGSANVTGTSNVVTAVHAGVQQYRFSMPNTLGASGTQMVYQLVFRDWAGNTTVTNNGVTGLVDCNLAVYCTAKASSIPSCVPTLFATGTPSASAGSGFVVSGGPLPGANTGLFLYTTKGAAPVPISNNFGFLCILPSGMFRIATQNVGGNSGVCNGQLNVDFNAYFATQTNNPFLVAGSRVDLQGWYRDPPNLGGANFTNAGTFYMCP